MHFTALDIILPTLDLTVLADGMGKAEERLRSFDDLAGMNDSSPTEEDEGKAFAVFGRGGSLKMRYALDEVAVAVAAAVAMEVARRRDAIR